MIFAAIALWFAFPYKVYAGTTQASTAINKGVSLQSISSNLRETINPKDIVTDAVHNFHPQYQQYIQQGSGVPASDDLRSYREFQERVNNTRPAAFGPSDSYQRQQLETPASPDTIGSTTIGTSIKKIQYKSACLIVNLRLQDTGHWVLCQEEEPNITEVA
jgi:hypothetical protein